MLIEIPDLGAVLIIAALFFGGGFMLYLFSRLRSGQAPEKVMPSSFDRLDYYEKQIVDMKIRLDAMDLDEPNFVEKSSLEEIESELPKRPRKRNQGSKPLVQKTPQASRIPNMSFQDSVEHVLKLITQKPMTSRDIEMTFGSRSREHVSRLMKKLFEDGLVYRDTASRPYLYTITDQGMDRINSKENTILTVSQA